METVAVVIPAYNHARFVSEAVASASAQGDCVSEILVVDDGSKDHIASVIREIHEPKLRFIQQENKGPSAARNLGWRSTKAEWVFFLDADDTLAPGALNQLLSAVANQPKPTIPYGFQEIYARDFSEPPRHKAYLSTRSGRILRDVAAMYTGTIFVAAIPRTCLEEINGFHDEVMCGEDLDLALQLALRFPFLYVDRPVHRTRMHDSNRHREFEPRAYLDFVHSVERAFKGRWNPWELWFRQQGVAYHLMAYAVQLRRVGKLQESKAAYRRAWMTFPPRIGNLRRWLF